MIKLAEVFQDGMILQRGRMVRIWGESSSKEEISVFLNKEKLMSFKIPKGPFSFFLPPQEAKENASLQIGEITLKNVDFGDIYLAGGQSNMEFWLRYDFDYNHGFIPEEDKHLRNFTLGQYEFEGEKEEGLVKGVIWDKWVNLEKDNCQYMSAVALYFAMKLRKDLKVPIGILSCNFGGSKASSWVKKGDLKGDLEVYIKEYEDGLKKMDIPSYLKMKKEMRAGMSDSLSQKMLDGMMLGGEKMAEAFKMMQENAIENHQDPAEIQKRMAVYSQIGPLDKNRPEGLYDTMLSKIKGFSLKGVLFYQGESDDYHGELYQELFTALIKRWRLEWEEELPFFFVQLAPFGTWMGNNGKKFPLVRKCQEEVFKSVKGTYMISSSDVGDLNDIHPKKKKPLGERLALAAENNLYGFKVEWLAPKGVSFTRNGEVLEVSFTDGKGLYFKGEEVNGLEIFLDGRKIKPLKEEIKDDKLIIILPFKAEGKIRLEFAQQDYYQVNLYNRAGLPCFPFVLEEA
ncbi:MAG: sialate O-acetylesterase [Bacilli bacterium]|jgi:sialate O-acetylesterase|nr:sialate O-acetylesterase [Bacilli bacterium]